MKKLILLPLFVLLLSGFGYPQTEREMGYRLQVLEMDETGVVLELRLTDFAIEERRHEGVSYRTVAVPGLAPLSEPGQPQLPGLGTLLGTPPGGMAHVKVLEMDTETMGGIRLLPAPALTYPDPAGTPVETFILDADLYARDTLFPASPAEVGLTGSLRDQPFAQVLLHPFQYNPLRQTLEVHRRMRLQVLFAASAAAPPNTPSLKSRPNTPYERLLQASLLNYAALPPVSAWSQKSNPPTLSSQNQAPALKIFIAEDGLYQVTHDELQNAGFNLSGVDPRRLQLRVGGTEVPIYVNGEGDGIFDPQDWLEFYGTAISGEFTTRNVYWLAAGEGPGLRMAERDGTPSGAGATAGAFFTALHLEENHEYWQLLPNGEGQDHWFWERFPSAPYSSNFSFKLQNVANLEADAVVRVALHGRTSTVENPDHHTQIFLNGTLIDEAWWDGQVPFIHEITVPQQLFQEGSNRLRVKTPGDTGAGVDSLYVDDFDVGYWDTYVAENDELYFTAPGTGTYTFEVSNFNAEAIQVYDVSDPFQASRLTNGVVTAKGNTYQIQFEDGATPETRYLALTAGQKRTPAGFLLDNPSAWKSPDNSADYLIITHEDFSQAASRLAAYRAGQGLRVVTVQITDIYDEFSGGVFDPQAIRDFLNYAYHNWTPPAPLYVLLLGDANYDYQDYLGTGNENFVPTHLFESPLIGQTPTDNWVVAVSGDDPLPDMFIGRLSVRTPAQAEAVVDKILAYGQNPTPDPWQQQALFVADDEADFEAVSDGLIAMLPIGYTPRRIYASTYSLPYDPTADIVEAIDQGTLIVNYVGHGSVTAWSSWLSDNIFQKSDISDLNNGPRYPLLVTGNCNNGLFAHPTIDEALAERFVNIEGQGGIAAWSPTGLGYTFWHEGMVAALYDTIFNEFTHQLGPATTAAKVAAFAQLGWTEPVEMFTLFGDPALTLQVVQPHLTLENVATAAQVLRGQSLTYRLAYANVGNEPIENVVLTETYDPHTVFDSAIPPPTQGDNVWEIGPLQSGASGMITVTVHVLETTPGGTTLVNQATLTGDGFATQSATAYTFVEYFRAYLPQVSRH